MSDKPDAAIVEAVYVLMGTSLGWPGDLSHDELMKAGDVDSRNYARLYLAHIEPILAQHEETGRIWSGPRHALPPRFYEIPHALNKDSAL